MRLIMMSRLFVSAICTTSSMVRTRVCSTETGCAGARFELVNRNSAASAAAVLKFRWNIRWMMDLLIAQRFDRVQIGRFPGGIGAEDDADQRTDSQTDEDPIHRQHLGQLHAI